ncbi:MAG: FG-GAP repeat domain-containing protein [Armatimonadota bacterium]|jgi:hypothetical protein
MSTRFRFRHVVIDDDPPGAHHDITLLHDLTGSGLPDVIIGGKEGPPNLFWYENPGGRGPWRCHEMAEAPDLEAGGVLLDVNGDERPDIVAGQQWRDGKLLWWFECPEDPREPWAVRVITDRFAKYHDQAVGDVDGDGEPELVFLSQFAGVLGYYDIPDDPTVEPWPEECLHLIDEEIGDAEGLAIVDLDGDGVTEIVAGTSIFTPEGRGAGRWSRVDFAGGYTQTRVAVADLRGLGAPDIVLVEGESDEGRMAVCAPPEWEPRLLRAGLFHPHSLEIADFDGDGLPDIFVAEMGLGRNPHDPLMMIFRNRGGGEFEEHVICEGIPTHEAKVADMTGDGRPDIVGKPYDPERQIDLWVNEG